MSPLLVLASFFVEPSRAQEAQPPPAIPMARPDLPHTPSELQAAMAFRSGHLEIRTITSWRGGGSTVVTSGYYGYGHRGHGSSMGVGVSTVVPEPMVAQHGWTVFQGPQRLSVPAYLTLVGDSRADEFRRRIRSNRTTGGFFTAVGVAGVAAVVTGIIGSANADTRAERENWNTVTLAGTGGILFGFTIGSVAQNTAQKLTYDYDRLGWDPTRAQVDAYNEQLRRQLGLSTEQAWRIIEEGGPR